MRLKNILIVVENIERSKQFYHDLFGLDMVLDNDGNMILTEGLVLQDREIWEKFLEKDIIPESNACELYFEERDIEAFAQKLRDMGYEEVRLVDTAKEAFGSRRRAAMMMLGESRMLVGRK